LQAWDSPHLGGESLRHSAYPVEDVTAVQIAAIVSVVPVALEYRVACLILLAA
jgi:hypothetical protein